MPDDLPAGYYLRNFIYLLEFVAGRYAAILSASEKALYDGFQELSPDAQKLYVRLCSRKGPLFRTDKLVYEDIADIDLAARELTEKAFVDCGPDSLSEEMLVLCTKAELLDVVATTQNAATNLKKGDVVELAASVILRQQLPGELPFSVLQPLRLAELRVFRLLFFGNLHQDMTEFVLHELGVAPFESYEIDDEARFFSDRAILDETLALYDFSELVHDAIDSGDKDLLLTLSRALPDKNSDLGTRFDRIVNRIARQLERYQCLDDALALYRDSVSVPARERAARLLLKKECKEAAANLCKEIICSPWDEAEYEFGVKFLRRLLAKEHPLQCALPRLEIDLEVNELLLEPKDSCSVETLVCHWAQERGFAAYYVENGLLPGLFGLAFWDIIFAPVKGAFFNPFQRGPADLFQTIFVDVRANLLSERFA
jgi:hypothetical protein